MNTVIAIDGPAGSGKSTVARLLAERLGLSFLDTGAMYRAVTALAIRRGIDVTDEDALTSLASTVDITTTPRVIINDLDVTEEIRTSEINSTVSMVAAVAGVREAMVRRQREFAERQPRGTVVEGRDIGTVVFPQATLKVFLTAELAVRETRRAGEGSDSIASRDLLDSSRASSPLRIDADAIELDTTHLTVEQVVGEISAWLKAH
ncbi:MAG: (d)CMP kinase [Acidobacteria bacterium]|nr:(d)CMP kinase [Acidobacteriota bacterium]